MAFTHSNEPPHNRGLQGADWIERGSVGERMSGWVKYGGVVYTSGQVGSPGPEVDGVKTAKSVTEQALPGPSASQWRSNSSSLG